MNVIEKTMTAKFETGTLSLRRGMTREGLSSRLGLDINTIGGIRESAGHVTITREAFDRMTASAYEYFKSDLPLSKATPVGLVQELVLARMGAIPGDHFSGVSDVASEIDPPAGFNVSDYREKRERFSRWLNIRQADHLLLNDLNVQNWLLGGLDFHEITAQSVARFLVPKDAKERVIVSINNIEKPRIIAEEMQKGIGLNWEDHVRLEVSPWHSPSDIGDLISGSSVIKDNEDPSFHELHYSLTDSDIKTYKWLGSMATAALNKQAHFIRFGQDTEAEVAARIQKMLTPHEIFTDVLLVSGDGKLMRTNHPIPRKDSKIFDTALMVLCARHRGYIVNVSRIVNRGPIAERMRRSLADCARIASDADYATRPGNTYGSVLSVILDGYRRAGFPQGFELCHAGGPTGIGIRDLCVSNRDDFTLIGKSQPFTWNPVIDGVKVENTVLTSRQEGVPPQVITSDVYGWEPSMEVVHEDGFHDHETGIFER